VVLQEIDQHDRQAFMARDLRQGHSLDHDLMASPLPLAGLLEDRDSTCRCSAAAPAKGIIHRDTKPANISQTQPGQTKILDFGSAKLAAEIYPADQTVGATAG
jgi:eukaryotic-like serine/threonine-protein kinase